MGAYSARYFGGPHVFGWLPGWTIHARTSRIVLGVLASLEIERSIALLERTREGDFEL